MEISCYRIFSSRKINLFTSSIYLILNCIQHVLDVSSYTNLSVVGLELLIPYFYGLFTINTIYEISK